MKKSKIYLIVASVLLLVIAFFVTNSMFDNTQNENKDKNEEIDLQVETNLDLTEAQIDIIKALVGLESKSIKISQNPLRVDGRLCMPQETMKSFVNYYLGLSKNEQIEDINVKINESALTLQGKYKFLPYLKTSIDIDVEPTLTKEKDLKLILKDIRVLNLSVNENIIDAIVKSWFSDLDNITVDKGDIIINKKFFGHLNLNNISIEEENLIVDLGVNIESTK